MQNQYKSIITTPLFYVNSHPHIGHLYSMIYANAIAQYKQISLLTGTDEHGLKVYKSAQGQNIQQYCDRISERFYTLSKEFIKFNQFVRTTDESHINRVKSVWKQLLQSNQVHKDIYKGYYCTVEEAFVQHQTDHYVEEENYFFKFNQEFVNNLISNGPDQYRKDLGQVKLDDLCVSRPKTRQQWGIEIDDNTLIYVWIDALCGYLQPEPMNYKHVIGKDILRFHAIYWPSILNALGDKSTTELIIHNHWLRDNIKMSKSLRNIVDPFHLLKKYSHDQIRLYFLSQGPQNHDVSYDDALLEKCWNDYIDKFNNLLYRLISPKLIKPNQIIINLDQLDEIQLETKQVIENHEQNYKKYMDQYKIIEAYQELRKIQIALNQLVTRQSPWGQEMSKREQIIGFCCIFIERIQKMIDIFVKQKQLVDLEYVDHNTIKLTIDLTQNLFQPKFKI